MDIQHAILGILSWRSMSGYDLKRIISDSDLFYWSGNNNQIYNNLIELHRSGLVSQEIREQENLPAKKIYSITQQGRETLRQWSCVKPELPEIHHPFLIQLVWSGSLPPDSLDMLLQQYADELRTQSLMRCKSHAEHQTLIPEENTRERFLWQQIGEHLLDHDERELIWIEQLRQRLYEV